MSDPFPSPWRLMTILCAGLALCILLVACGSDEGPTATTATTTPEATRSPSIPIIPPGETATSDDAEITIHGVRRSSREGAGSPPVGFEWLLVDLSLSNTSPQPFSLHASLTHADGRMFERVSIPAITAGLDTAIAAGAALRGEIAFLVDKGMLGGILIYGPDEERWALELGMIRDRQ